MKEKKVCIPFRISERYILDSAGMKVLNVLVCQYILSLYLVLSLYPFSFQISLLFDNVSQKPRGYAFIEYEHERDMHGKFGHFSICQN